MSPSHDEANIVNQRNQLQTEVEALQRETSTLKEHLERAQANELTAQRELIEAEDKLNDVAKKFTRTKSDLVESNSLVTELQEELRLAETQQRRTSHSLENERFTREQAERESKRLAEQLENLQVSSNSEKSQNQAEVQRLEAALTEATQRGELDLERAETAFQTKLEETIARYEERVSELESVLQDERVTLKTELSGQKDQEVESLKQELEDKLQQATEDFEERIEELERDHRLALDEAQGREEDLETQLSQLKREIDANDDQARRSVLELNEIRVSFSQTQRDLEALQVRYEQERQQTMELQRELGDQRRLGLDAEEEFKQQLESFQTKATEHQSAQANLQQEITALQLALSEHEESIGEREQLLTEEHARFEVLKQTLEEEREGFKKARSELDQLRGDHESLSSEHQDKLAQLTQLEATLSERDSAFALVEEEHNKQTIRLNELEEELNQREDYFDTLTNEKANVEAELADLRTQFSAQAQDMKLFDEERSALNDKITSLSEELELTKEQLSSVQDEILSHLEQQEELENQVNELKAQLQSTSNSWKTEVDALQTDIKHHIEEIRKRDESLATLHEDLAFESERARTLDEELNRAKQRLSRELGLEREGRERLNKQVVELNSQVSQFSQLSQKIGQSLDIAQQFLEHMHHAEFEVPQVVFMTPQTESTVDTDLAVVDKVDAADESETSVHDFEVQVAEENSDASVTELVDQDEVSEALEINAEPEINEEDIVINEVSVNALIDHEEDYDLSLSAVSSVPPESAQADSLPPSGQPMALAPVDEGEANQAEHRVSQGPEKIDFIFDEEEDADETNSPGAVLSSGAPKELEAEPTTQHPSELPAQLNDGEGSSEGDGAGDA